MALLLPAELDDLAEHRLAALKAATFAGSTFLVLVDARRVAEAVAFHALTFSFPLIQRFNQVRCIARTNISHLSSRVGW